MGSDEAGRVGTAVGLVAGGACGTEGAGWDCGMLVLAGDGEAEVAGTDCGTVAIGVPAGVAAFVLLIVMVIGCGAA